MDSLESKLGEILSSPEKMEQVMKIAGELLGSGAFSAGDAAADAPEEGAPAPGEQAAESSGGAPDLSSALPAIMSMLGSGSGTSNFGGEAAQGSSTVSGGNPLSGLGNIDPRFMSAVMQVLGTLGKDDDGTRLLRALRPHLRAERCERLDHAIQIMRISSAIRAAIHSFSGGAGNVQQI